MPLVQGRTRMLLLIVIIAVIVLVPLFLQQRMVRSALVASELVAHSRQVDAEVHEVIFQVRDFESAVLALALGIDTPSVRKRLNESVTAVSVRMGTLQTLTHDNADQQLRLGKLEAMVERRIELAREVAGATDMTRLREAATDLATQYPVRDLANEMFELESHLLEQRMASVARVRQQAETLAVVAALAQLLLLGMITVLWQRENNQRVAIERVATLASARAEVMLLAVREPIALIDADQKLLMVNPAFAELYAVDAHAVVGKPLAEVGGGVWNDSSALQRLRDVLARDRELWDYDLIQRMADGIERRIVINAARMPLPDSEDRVILMTASDMTTQTSSEERVRELNRQLEGKVGQVSEVNRELEAFSYLVSHDLRAPLRHIAGFADKLGRQLGDDADEKSRHYLEVIGASAKRMATLIDDLLVYSRLGRNAMRLQTVDMQSLVAETRAMLDSTRLADPEQAQRQVEWRIGPMPVVIADENMLRQVWQNLLGNALKYSAQRSPAVIEVEYERLDDDSHHFTVRDNGAGFDMAYATKLFGVFQRLHKASDYAGTGIGLASVRRVIARHEGRVWAEAIPDGGATFHFTLPAMLDASARQELPT